MYLIDQAGNGTDALAEAANTLVAQAQASGKVDSLRGNDNATKPALRLDIDQQKAEAFGLTLSDVNSMLSTIFSGSYVNDFVLGTKLREVIVQGDAPWRMQPGDVEVWHART